MRRPLSEAIEKVGKENHNVNPIFVLVDVYPDLVGGVQLFPRAPPSKELVCFSGPDVRGR